MILGYLDRGSACPHMITLNTLVLRPVAYTHQDVSNSRVLAGVPDYVFRRTVKGMGFLNKHGHSCLQLLSICTKSTVSSWSTVKILKKKEDEQFSSLTELLSGSVVSNSDSLTGCTNLKYEGWVPI